MISGRSGLPKLRLSVIASGRPPTAVMLRQASATACLPPSIVPHAYWFGEDQARYIVTVAEDQVGRVLAKMRGCAVPCVRIGTTADDVIAIAGEPPVSVATLRRGFENWFPAYMSGANSRVVDFSQRKEGCGRVRSTREPDTLR